MTGFELVAMSFVIMASVNWNLMKVAILSIFESANQKHLDYGLWLALDSPSDARQPTSFDIHVSTCTKEQKSALASLK